MLGLLNFKGVNINRLSAGVIGCLFTSMLYAHVTVESLKDFKKISSLSFVRQNQPIQLELADSAAITLWNVAQLEQSLWLHDEYLQFATSNFMSLYPIKSHVENGASDCSGSLQIEVIRFLLAGMLNAIEAAQKPLTTYPDASLDTERNLQVLITNLQQAAPLLVQLQLVFQQFGWEYKESTWHQSAHLTALHVLEISKQLGQLHLYTADGLQYLSDSNINEYLFTQRRRAEYLTFTYVEPALMLLHEMNYTQYQELHLVQYWLKNMAILRSEETSTLSNSASVLEQQLRSYVMSGDAECGAISTIDADLFMVASRSLQATWCNQSGEKIK